VPAESDDKPSTYIKCSAVTNRNRLEAVIYQRKPSVPNEFFLGSYQSSFVKASFGGGVMPQTQQRGPVTVLKSFFGYLPGQTISEFKTEVDRLSEQEKLELARLAAKQLGLSQAEVSFKLD
jgi:hypothetical protein